MNLSSKHYEWVLGEDVMRVRDAQGIMLQRERGTYRSPKWNRLP